MQPSGPLGAEVAYESVRDPPEIGGVWPNRKLHRSHPNPLRVRSAASEHVRRFASALERGLATLWASCCEFPSPENRSVGFARGLEGEGGRGMLVACPANRASALPHPRRSRRAPPLRHATRSYAMILLAYRHGLRASEVTNLRVSDLRHPHGQG